MVYKKIHPEKTKTMKTKRKKKKNEKKRKTKRIVVFKPKRVTLVLINITYSEIQVI